MDQRAAGGASHVSRSGGAARYVASIQRAPDSDLYVYWNPPESLRHWGVEVILRLFHASTKTVLHLESEDLPADRMATLLIWSARDRHLQSLPFRASDFTSIEKRKAPAPWQLINDWHADENGWRRMVEMRSLRLCRPNRESRLLVEVCGPPGQGVRAFVDFKEVQPALVKKSGCEVVQLAVPETRVGIVHVELTPSASDQDIRLGDIRLQ